MPRLCYLTAVCMPIVTNEQRRDII